MAYLKRQYSVEGLNLERFLNKAAGADVSLLFVKREAPGRMIIRIRSREDSAIREIAQQGGWQLRDMGTYGVYTHISRLLHHKGRICFLTAALMVVFAVSQCIWKVDIVNAGAYTADIRNYLSDSGITLPFLRNHCNLDRIREILNWRYPDIAFIECSFRGTTLLVRVHEGQSGNQTGYPESGDVIAARDGIIKSVVTAAGTPVVQAGDIVKQGDVLILGEENGRDGSKTDVYASGCIMARVWESAHVSVPISEHETQYTGNSITDMTVSLPWFDLWRIHQPGFERYDVHISEQPFGGVFLPLTIRKSCFAEYHTSENTPDPDELMEHARQTALHQLLADNGFADDFVDKWVEYSMIEDEVVCASAYGERIIDIAAHADAE